MAKKSTNPSKAKELSTTVDTLNTPATTDEPLTTPTLLLPQTEVTKLNTCDLSSLKTTLDDLVREFFSLPSHNFTPSNLHTDVRLLLGWSSVLIALGTTYYAYKIDDFKESKFLTGCGVAMYALLNTVLAWWVSRVEKNIVWIGKRRTIASRITTELLEISSSAHSTPSPSSLPYPLSLFLSSPKHQTKEAEGKQYPLYKLKLNYTQSANANKSLLGSQELELERCFSGLFDSEGKVARGEVEKWLSEGLEKVTAGAGGKVE